MKKQSIVVCVLPILLAVVLLISVFPTSAAQQQLPAEADAQIASEDASKRETSSKQFLREDRTYIVAAYGLPVNYNDNGY